MDERKHLRHRPPRELSEPRELVLVAPPMRSNVNLSRIVRAAGCCGVRRLIACGNPKLDRKIARDGIDHVQLETPRSLVPVLKKLRIEGFQLVGLEQTSDSVLIYDHSFVRKTALVIGHERDGIQQETLDLLDVALEIPVYGLPYSFNAATATAIALYEFCRQFPDG